MASVGTIKYNNGSSWVDILHPINSFYISYTSTSPASLFGGTWTQITNAVLRGATGVGYTGSDTHTLTINEMPSHSHTLSGVGNTTGTNGGWQAGGDTDRLYYGKYNAGRNVFEWVGKWTDNNGGGAAHSIVQRSFNCYIWYRTA